jgi:hypothetical protein
MRRRIEMSAGYPNVDISPSPILARPHFAGAEASQHANPVDGLDSGFIRTVEKKVNSACP